MDWKTKALIQNLISNLPEALSYNLYYLIQRKFGGLRKVDPLYDLNKSRSIASILKKNNLKLKGKTFLEIGTGRNLNTPIGLWICGATKIITVDLNPYLKEELVIDSVMTISKSRHQIINTFKNYLPVGEIEKKLSVLSSINDINSLFEKLNIEYIAPADASYLPLKDSSIDYHLSVNTLEHIPKQDLFEIFLEARRLLCDEGYVIHLIDLSDHFSHSDNNISSVNFLQYSDEKWNQIAGNRFMYHNRIRAVQFDTIFNSIGIKLIYRDETVDDRAVSQLNKGFPIDNLFTCLDNEELAVSKLNVVGKF